LDQQSQEPQHGIFCPSCAARIEEPVTPGALIKCPICGTEFIANPNQSAETSVIQNDKPAQTPAARRLSTEEILLERLKTDKPPQKPLAWKTFVIILVVILGATYGIYRWTAKPDKYAANSEVDSSMLLQKRMFYQHIVDSLRSAIAANPQNDSLHLSLADALYDVADWNGSVKEFQTYLAAKPRDPDARVDYAFAIAQQTNNLHLAISEIDTALIYQPDHLNALVNAGILTAQTVSDSNHAQALAKSKEYFERAKAVAEKTNPKMALRIDTLIQAIDKTGERLPMK